MSDTTKRILRMPDVIEMTGLSRSTIWRLAKAQEFPASFRLGPPGSKAVGWKEEEVGVWIEGLQPAA